MGPWCDLGHSHPLGSPPTFSPSCCPGAGTSQPPLDFPQTTCLPTEPAQGWTPDGPGNVADTCPSLSQAAVTPCNRTLSTLQGQCLPHPGREARTSRATQSTAESLGEDRSRLSSSAWALIPTPKVHARTVPRPVLPGSGDSAVYMSGTPKTTAGVITQHLLSCGQVAP